MINNKLLREEITIPKDGSTIETAIEEIMEQEDSYNLLIFVAIQLLQSKTKNVVNVTNHGNTDEEYNYNSWVLDCILDTGIMFVEKGSSASLTHVYINSDTIAFLLKNDHLKDYINLQEGFAIL